MVGFRTKKIETTLTLGEELKAKRTQQYISLEKVAFVLKISKDYLEFLERGVYEKLPGEVYAKNFIKVYAQYLGLNSQDLLDLYKRERTVHHNLNHSQKFAMKEPAKILSRLHFLSTPRIARNLIVLGVAFIGFFYIGFKVEAIIRPPDLEVAYPATDILTEEKFIEVKGKTIEGAHVVINGQTVFVEEGGIFTEKVNLLDGINEIKISSKKDHSKENIEYRRVVFKDKK